MVGAKTEIESHAHLRHCHDHALQLVVREARSIEARDKMRGNVDVAFVLNKLTRYSMVKNHGKKSNTFKNGRSFQ